MCCKARKRGITVANLFSLLLPNILLIPTCYVFSGKTKDKIAPCIFFLNTDLDWHNVSPSL